MKKLTSKFTSPIGSHGQSSSAISRSGVARGSCGRCPECFDGLAIVDDPKWGLVYETCKDCKGSGRANK